MEVRGIDGAAPEARDRRVRRAWILFAVAVAMWAATVVGYLIVRPEDAGNWGSSSLVANVPFLLMVLSFDVVGVMIATRRPGNSIGWIILAIGFSWSAGDIVGGLSSIGIDRGWPGADILEAVLQPLWAPPIALSAIYLILLFPDGHLPSPRWRPFAWAVAIGIVLACVAILFLPGTFADTGHPDISNPLAIEALRGPLSVLLGALLVIPVGMIGAAVALVRRYRRSRGIERQQMKWLAFSAAIVALAYATVMPLSLLHMEGATPRWLLALQNVSLATFALIPIAIGFAVLKHRLYDIDVVINKTIVFGALALFIGAV